MLGDKIEVKKEIEATLAAKKSEQMIMSLMPAGIILLSEADFAGIPGCTVWKSFWNLCHDCVYGGLWSVLLAGY